MQTFSRNEERHHKNTVAKIWSKDLLHLTTLERAPAASKDWQMMKKGWKWSKESLVHALQQEVGITLQWIEQIIHYMVFKTYSADDEQ